MPGAHNVLRPVKTSLGHILLASWATHFPISHYHITMVTEPEYDVPSATAAIFADLLADERLRLPKAVVDAADVEFEGASLPYLCAPSHHPQ